MNDLITRILSGIVYIAVFIFCTMYSKFTYLGLIATFSLIGLWEFLKLIEYKSFIPYVILLATLALFTFNANIIILSIALFICLIGLIYLIVSLYQQKHKTVKTNIKKSLIALLYIVLPFGFLIKLPFTNEVYQSRIVLGIIILIWCNDSFAYLTGRTVGKHKLFERISPKKTIEGFVGGLLFSCAASILISNYFTFFSINNWMVIAVLTSIFGTYGDLVESKFKRLANVKDSGNIMPGHGGILDRLDSLFFMAPFVYLYVHFII